MRTLLFILMAAVLCGCTTRYTETDMAAPPSSSLETGKIAYIVTPLDGSYGEQVYAQSGMHTAQLLDFALKPYVTRSVVGPYATDMRVIMNAAKKAGARYVFIPMITNWEHRRAVWSKRSSEVGINMRVYDVRGEKQLLMRDLRVEGRQLTVKSQYPEEIVTPLLERFTRDIFLGAESQEGS